jgi:hypothetical protein
VRLHSTKLAAPITLLTLTFAGACRNGPRDVTANDALQRDLELAQASAVNLARRDLPATRVVSALEAGEQAVAGKGTADHPARHSPTKRPRTKVDHAPPAPAPAAAPQAVAQAAAEAPQVAAAPAPTPAPEEPAPARSENPTMSGPSNDGVISVSPTDGEGGGGVTVSRRGRGIGGIIGGILGGIGGVMGGMGDDDHCERDHPRRGAGVPIGVGGIPIGFPTRGGYGVPPTGAGRGGVRGGPNYFHR